MSRDKAAALGDRREAKNALRRLLRGSGGPPLSAKLSSLSCVSRGQGQEFSMLQRSRSCCSDALPLILRRVTK
jgi:hypothetical protein